MNRCSFCGCDTDFLAHSEHLCLSCGDTVMGYTPEQTLDMAKSFAKCVNRYLALSKPAGEANE